MKKLSLFLLAILVLSINKNFAQKTQQKNYHFGFKFSPNIGWLNPDTRDYSNDGTSLGFSWGFISEFPFAENYSIVTGFNVVQTSGKLSIPYQQKDENGVVLYEGKLKRNYHLKYLEIPLMLRMQTKKFNYKIGDINYYGQIGLCTGFNLRAKADDDYDIKIGQEKNSENNVDIKDNITLIRESLNIGGGIRYNIGAANSLLFGINFNNGFVDILKGHNTKTDEKEDAILNYFEISVGVLF